MSDDEIRALIRKRGSLKTKLTIFSKYVATLTGADIDPNDRTTKLELEQRTTRAELILETFDEIQGEIEFNTKDDQLQEQVNERETFENEYYSLLANAKACLEKFEIHNDNDNESNYSARSSSRHEGVKLPEIRLPKFDGSYETWMEFRDMFDSLINSNTQLNNIQKFHYLRASLIGSAPQVIQSLEFTSNNYATAWQTLCDRFNNKQLLIQNHIRAIFNLENIDTPSSTKIRFLYENLFKHLSILSQLGEPTDKWDTLIIYIISGKLDKATTHEWEKQRSNMNLVTINDFKEFLRKRANLLETIEMNTGNATGNQNTTRQRNFNDNRKHLNYRTRGFLNVEEKNDIFNPISKTTPKNPCFNCNKSEHSLFYCPDFLKLSVNDRIFKVKNLHLCMNCLRKGHLVKDCKWSGCKICGYMHNTILHESKNTTKSAITLTQENINETGSANAATISNTVAPESTYVTSCSLATAQHAVLSTAQVRAGRDENSESVTIRALLDCGSQSSFITSDLCHKLNLKKIKHKLAISGVSNKLSYAEYKCELLVRSINNSYSFTLSCFVLEKITNEIPDAIIDTQQLNIPVNIQLADPEFYIPQRIDILIGADAFWKLLNVGQINLGFQSALLQNTRLGWIVAGSMSMPTNKKSSKSHCNLATNKIVQDQLSKFWEIEEIENKKTWSMEEQACENHFIKHVSTTNDGRFVVALPFKESTDKLGESREIAIKRFLALERKLMSNEGLRKSYIAFLTEYESLGHMTLIDDNNHDDCDIEYYMPHHGVYKEASTSTKLRVVFNASSPTSTGLSLNDIQMTGPIIQQDLLSIILRFRMRSIVLSGDIKMMYRQIFIKPEQRQLQKIVWRASPNEPIKTFQLNTVTYGTTAASFLAIRCLHKIADECENEYPLISKIIKNDMYVDDLLTAVDTEEDARYVYEIISMVLLKHGFELRKWKCNKKDVLLGSKHNNNSNIIEFSENKNGESKTLGLLWESDRDILTFKIRNINDYSHPPQKVTKRQILSKIATIFDPLGLLSPCIIIAKVLLQKLWSENLSWDDPLPSHILETWLEFANDLDTLNGLIIERKVICENAVHLELHGFADASETSYGACVYVVSVNSDNKGLSNLLCAKSKVAPIKPLTMPRLELCAALTVSKLIKKCLDALDVKFENIYCWSDSTIVLGWLKASPSSLKPFVANRVATIQNLTSEFEWKHVRTLDNPADIVSRGLMPSQLIESRMWFHGPQWLSENSEQWPNIHIVESELPEKRNVHLLVLPPKMDFIFDRFSNLNKLKRTFAYGFRFIKNCRIIPESRQLSCLTVTEVELAFMTLIKFAQQESFGEDYYTLKRGNALPSNSKILSLHPFLDKNDVLRVGGRLTNSDFAYSKKHPILLSPTHRLTTLLFEYEHTKLLHAGPQLLLSTIRDNFWPISGRNISRKIVRSCVKCSRYNVQTLQPIMGNLPKNRVKPSLPFSVVGVDYAGPFTMKDKPGRGCKPIKCWVALFVCFATRAIHIQLVLSLSANDFLQAFKRFVGRRGKPFEVYSDNGTNFIRANKELADMGEFLKSNSTIICDDAASMNVRWHFVPTNSPHFGGIWEAAVKSLKYHLKRTVGNYVLYFFDFQTLLIRVEAILNSRPLSPLTSNPDDLTPLTPAHFLIGRSAMSVIEFPLPDVKENRLTNYQLLQKLYEQFWLRWSREYISELQQRRRWKQTQGSLEINQMVLIKDSNLPPAMWRLGRIINLIVGQDGVSRVAAVRTAAGVVSQAIVRLCPLPIVS